MPFDDERWTFAVLDDIYDLHDRETWNSLIREQFNFQLPRVALITCGPTEQKDQFSIEMSDCFDVHPFIVPKIDDNEWNEFLSWYQKRTQKDINKEKGGYPLLSR